MKKLQGRDYDKEIQEIQEIIQINKAQILLADAEKLKLQSSLEVTNNNVIELSRKIDGIPTNVIDIHEVQSKIKKTKNKIISLS